ncbi:hypothetical protein HBA54_03175 [Pelagibius litoralis]|uniref:Uncharacterized protein n=1 Tax=Pelagibius litoralis TaxID=374515 RepID=A0A967C369_9PROT|nr:hypothetical protein [Pelagibius litoralis]NIA67584.1 hypothetical protein [Pelagibius litoralis]
MAFVLKQLAPAGNNSRSRKGAGAEEASVAMWTYFHATDALAAVKAAGYFNAARGLLGPGDFIFFSQNGAACQIITVSAVPSDGTNVTIQTADINSA